MRFLRQLLGHCHGYRAHHNKTAQALSAAILSLLEWHLGTYFKASCDRNMLFFQIAFSTYVARFRSG